MLAILEASSRRVILDEDDAMADALRLRVTPAVLTVSFGQIARSEAVATARQVMSMIPATIPGDGGAISEYVVGRAAGVPREEVSKS